MISKNVPHLRFPGFEGEWFSNDLASVAKFSKGKGLSKSDIVQNGATACIRYGELYTEYSEVISEVFSRTDIDKTALLLSEANDVIIPSSGETQIDIATASCVIESGIALGGDLNIIKTKQNGIFLSYYLNNARKKDIARLAQGNSVVHLYPNQLASLRINFPSLPEQTRIANFLTSVDKRITLLQKKKESFEQYKKGIMQKIFSQELRFKDENGNGFPDWEENRAKEVFYNYSNKNHDGDLPILSASQAKGMILRDKSGIQIQASERSVKSYKIVEPGNFVITLRSFQGGLDYSALRGICSPAYTVLKNAKPICNDFYKQYFKKESFIERLSKTVIGIRDGKQITFDAFGGLKIPYPSLPEQQKIADFLSAIDKSIEKVASQIELSQSWKKGLLQRMFV